jgi:CPA2 family monovalent cation:H+ antiporter-2
VVVSYHDTPSALKILRLVQRARAGKVPVIVRTIDDADLETPARRRRHRGGARGHRGLLMLASHALALVGVPMRKVIRITRDARDARYGLLRGYFHGADDDTVEELQQARLKSVTAARGRAPACGQPLGDLALHAVGVSVVSVRRAAVA